MVDGQDPNKGHEDNPDTSDWSIDEEAADSGLPGPKNPLNIRSLIMTLKDESTCASSSSKKKRRKTDATEAKDDDDAAENVRKPKLSEGLTRQPERISRIFSI